VPGVNLFRNGGFNSGANWTLTQTGAGIATIADGALYLKRPSSGDIAAASNTPIWNAIIGAVYDFEVAIERISGTPRIDFAGTNQTITQSGVTKFSKTAINANTAVFTSNAPAEYRVSYAIARLRSDQSMSKVILTLRDYDGDKKQTSLELGPVTDGASYVTREAEAAAIRDAVNAVAGNIASYDFLAQATEPNNTNASSPVFQTHVRWIVEMVDSVTGDGPYAFDIPTADLGTAALFVPNTNQHDATHAAWIALKAALNGKAINPRTGSTMNVTDIYLEE